MIIESYEISFVDFLNSTEGITDIAPETVLRIAYTEIYRIVFNTEWKELDTGCLIERVNSCLAENRIAYLNSNNVENIISSLMEYFMQFMNIETVSIFDHKDEIKRLVWAVIARYMDPEKELLDDLTLRIMQEFNMRKNIGTTEIAEDIVSQERFAEIPMEVLLDAVNGIFDYLVNEGMIEYD